jgi:hypothetical protein
MASPVFKKNKMLSLADENVERPMSPLFVSDDAD